jgi:hypothetical protein
MLSSTLKSDAEDSTKSSPLLYHSPAMSRLGSLFVALAYALLVTGALVGLPRSLRGDFRPEMAHLLSPWPLALAAALGAMGLFIALGPLRRGERWAIWAALSPLVITGALRVPFDPLCTTTVMSQHGCHMFLITLAVGTLGLAMCLLARGPRERIGDSGRA